MLRIIRLVSDYGCTTTQAHVLCSILHALGDSNNTQPSELMVLGILDSHVPGPQPSYLLLLVLQVTRRWMGAWERG